MDDVIREQKMMDRNITLEQYIKIVEDTKAAILLDLESLDSFKWSNPDNPVFSELGVQLCCRDDKDAFWVIGQINPELFLRFDPDLLKFIRDESVSLLQDDEPGQESAKDKLYWEVTKYKKINNQMCRIYVAQFSLECELVGVYWSCRLDPSRMGAFADCDDFWLYPEKYIYFSEPELYLKRQKEQLLFAENVDLPYQPGDILYIDARPFGSPFYAVYGAESDGDLKHFEWTKTEYGYYKRSHLCLYMSEDRNGLGISKLTGGSFTDYIPFPYAPLDRIKVVEACSDPLLMKVSRQLKEDPARFYTWLEIDEGHDRNEGMEYLFR